MPVVGDVESADGLIAASFTSRLAAMLPALQFDALLAIGRSYSDERQLALGKLILDGLRGRRPHRYDPSGMSLSRALLGSALHCRIPKTLDAFLAPYFLVRSVGRGKALSRCYYLRPEVRLFALDALAGAMPGSVPARHSTH